MAETERNSGLSRRTLVKAAGWSVPAIVIGSAAPAMALSPLLTVNSISCKNPGASCGNEYKKSYVFGFDANTQGLGPVCLAITSVQVAEDSAGLVLADPPNYAYFYDEAGGVEIGGCTCNPPNTLETILVTGPGTFKIVVGEFNESDNTRVVVTYTAYSYAGDVCGQTIPSPPADSGVRNTPPCQQISVPCPPSGLGSS